MYTLPQKDMNKVLALRLSDDSSVQERMAEEAVQRTLPHIAGLDAARTEAERLEIYKQTIGCQLESFVARNGSAFGELDLHDSGIVENVSRVRSYGNELSFLAA